MGHLLLDKNPFWILRTSPRQAARDVQEAYEDVLFDFPDKKQDIVHAHQILTNTRRRIEAEVAWFPGQSVDVIENIMAHRHDNAFCPDTNDPLARAHITLFRCTEGKAELSDVLNALSDINRTQTLDAINRDREISGITECTEDVFDGAWSSLMECYAAFVLEAECFNSDDGNDVFAALDQSVVSEQARSFVSHLKDGFSRRKQPAMDAAEREIREAIDAVAELTDQDELHILIRDTLIPKIESWAGIRLPEQKATKRDGISDKRSVELYLSIAKAVFENDKVQPDMNFSRTLFDVLEDTSREVPDAIVWLKQFRFISEIRMFCNLAADTLISGKQGFSVSEEERFVKKKRDVYTRTVLEYLDGAGDIDGDLIEPEMPWQIVLNMFHTAMERSAEADLVGSFWRRVIKVSRPPSSTLESDIDLVHRNILTYQINAATREKRYSTVIQLAEEGFRAISVPEAQDQFLLSEIYARHARLMSEKHPTQGAAEQLVQRINVLRGRSPQHMSGDVLVMAQNAEQIILAHKSNWSGGVVTNKSAEDDVSAGGWIVGILFWAFLLFLIAGGEG